MRLFLAASSSANRSNPSPTTEALTNCYAVPAPSGALAPLVIRSVPGLRSFSPLPGPFLRALARVEDRIYAVSAGGLYRVNEDGTSAWLAAIPDDPNTVIAGSRDVVTITAGGAYFTWDGTLTQPTGGAFDSMGSVAFLDQFTLLSERGGRRIQWTEPGLPATLDGLFFATAEARDDKIIRLVDTMGYVAILKAQSVEVWGASGLGAENAFVRIAGTVQDRGLAAFNLVCKTPDGAFYIDHDGTARLGTSAGSQVVSPSNVVDEIKAGTPTHVFYYEDRGHQFHVIRFADRPAWVYDAVTDFWHRRSSGVEHKPWDIICAVDCYGQWHLGHREGHIYRLGAEPHDDGAPLRRTIVTRPLYQDDEPFSIAELQLLGLFGNYSVEETAPNWLLDQNGLPLLDQSDRFITANTQDGVTKTSRPGRLWARFSRNGGYSWGTPKMRNIGKAGERGVTVKWRALGQYKHFTMEINITDPVDVPLLSEGVVTIG